MVGFNPEGAVKPSSLEVDSYNNEIGAYRTVAILHGNYNGTLVPISTNVDGHVLIGDTYGHGVVAAVDPITASQATIDVAHGEIHASRMWCIDNYIDLTNGQTIDFLFYAPTVVSGYETHLVFEVLWEVEGEFGLYEDPVTSANGTLITPINRRRSATTTLRSTVYSSPTVTSTGTILTRKRVGSGKGTGGTTRSNMEFILCCGKKYLFRFINRTTGDNLLNYQADWYEVPVFVP